MNHEPDNAAALQKKAPHSLFLRLNRYKHLNLPLVDQGIVSGANFVTTILLARYLGLEEFGVFTAAWMVMQFCNVLQTGLIIQPMMSIGPKQPAEEEPGYYGSVLVQQLLLSAICMLVLFLGLWGSQWVYPAWGLHTLALPLAFSTAAFQLQDFFRRYYFTIGKPEEALLNDSVSYIGQVLVFACLLLVVAGTSATGLWVIGVTSILASLLGWMRVAPLTFHKRQIQTAFQQHWRSGLWLTVTQVVQWFGSLQGILVTIAFMLGTRDLGGIRAVINIITGPVNIFLQGLQNILPSAASRALKNQGEPGLRQFLLRSGVVVLLALTFVVALVAMFRNELMQLFYGADFLSYANLIPWQGCYIMAVGINLPWIIFYRTIEKTKILAVSSALAAALSLLAAWLLVKQVALPAIFISVILGQMVMLVLMVWEYRKHKNLDLQTLYGGKA